MEKQRWEESERRRAEERRSEKRKSEKKEGAGAQKGRNVAKHCVFPMICGSGGSKGRLAKAAGAEPCGHMRDEKLHTVVARRTFPKSKCTKRTRAGALLEVEMSKKCTSLWREAQVQHFVWPGITLSWQAQYFRQMEWANRKTQWYRAVSSALNCPFLKEVSQNCFVFVWSISKIEEVSQTSRSKLR